jgi:hypothetical protein
MLVSDNRFFDNHYSPYQIKLSLSLITFLRVSPYQIKLSLFNYIPSFITLPVGWQRQYDESAHVVRGAENNGNRAATRAAETVANGAVSNALHLFVFFSLLFSLFCLSIVSLEIEQRHELLQQLQMVR